MTNLTKTKKEHKKLAEEVEILVNFKSQLEDDIKELTKKKNKLIPEVNELNNRYISLKFIELVEQIANDGLEYELTTRVNILNYIKHILYTQKYEELESLVSYIRNINRDNNEKHNTET